MIRIRALPSIPYAQVVVALVMLGSVADGFAKQGIPVLYPFIREDFGFTLAEVGLIASGFLLGGTVIAIYIGWLADAIGVRRLLTVAMVGTFIGFILFSQLQNLVQAILLAFLLAIAGSATAPASVKAIMDWVTPRTRGLAMGIMQTNVPAAGIIAAALFPVLALTFSWRTVVLALALFIAVSTIVFFLFYRDKPGSSLEGRKSGFIASVSQVIKNRDIWLVSLSNVTLMALQTVFVSYLILFLNEEVGMSVRVGGGFLAMAWAGGAVGRVVWGFMGDLMRGRRALVLVLIGLLAMVGMIFMALLPSNASPVVVGVLVFLVGSVTVGWQGVFLVLLPELAGPRLAGTVVGYVAIIRRLGAFGVPPLFGLIVDRTGSYDMGWWMMAGLASVGVLLLLFVRPQPRHG